MKILSKRQNFECSPIFGNSDKGKELGNNKLSLEIDLFCSSELNINFCGHSKKKKLLNYLSDAHSHYN